MIPLWEMGIPLKGLVWIANLPTANVFIVKEVKMENNQVLIEEYKKEVNRLNKKLKTWLISFLILLIITMIISFWYMFGGAGKCQNNPLQYGADLIAEKQDGNVQCECFLYKNQEERNVFGVYQKKIIKFSFSNKGFEILDIFDIDSPKLNSSLGVKYAP